MGVTFTSNVGLAKPDEAELAENWVNGPNYADDNNQIMIAKTNIPLTFYAPNIIASTTDPNLGTGNGIGEYQEHMGFIHGRFRLVFQDAGIVPGIGSYGIALPTLVDATYHNVGNTGSKTVLTSATGTFSCIGEGYIHDNSTPANCGTIALDVVTVSSTSYVRLVTESYAGKTTGVFASGQPFSFANLDAISGEFFYKKA